MNETDDQRRGPDDPPRVQSEREEVVMGEIVKGTVTGLRDGTGIEIDGRVVVVPHSTVGLAPRIGDLIEVTRMTRRRGTYTYMARITEDPSAIEGERVRVNGDWASASRVEAELLRTWGPEMTATLMAAARENAKLSDEQIKDAIDKMWDEVYGRRHSSRSTTSRSD